MNTTKQTDGKLREALRQAKEIARTIYSTSDKGSSHEDLAEKLVEITNAALAEPVRNYEVGTAEEQERRFGEYCDSKYDLNDKEECQSCPLFKHRTSCEFAWAQMPYSEGDGDAAK